MIPEIHRQLAARSFVKRIRSGSSFWRKANQFGGWFYLCSFAALIFIQQFIGLVKKFAAKKRQNSVSVVSLIVPNNFLKTNPFYLFL